MKTSIMQVEEASKFVKRKDIKILKIERLTEYTYRITYKEA